MNTTLVSRIIDRAQRVEQSREGFGLATYAQYVYLNRHLYGISRAELESKLSLPDGYVYFLENGLLCTSELPKRIRSDIRSFFKGLKGGAIEI